MAFVVDSASQSRKAWVMQLAQGALGLFAGHPVEKHKAVGSSSFQCFEMLKERLCDVQLSLALLATIAGEEEADAFPKALETFNTVTAAKISSQLIQEVAIITPGCRTNLNTQLSELMPDPHNFPLKFLGKGQNRLKRVR